MARSPGERSILPYEGSMRGMRSHTGTIIIIYFIIFQIYKYTVFEPYVTRVSHGGILTAKIVYAGPPPTRDVIVSLVTS